MYNVFEDVLPHRQGAEVRAIRNELVQQGALGACMSGTGPTVFGLFSEREHAEAARESLSQSYRTVWLTETI